jgi:hypothetical protein
LSEISVVQSHSSSGQAGGGAIIDYEFGSATDLRKKLADMKQKLNLTKEFFREVMQEGVDYGIIPGTDKPTLLKPGAEGLCEFYNFAPTIAGKVEDKNHESGYYAVDITIRLIHRASGAIIGEGVGHANTFESRYRWRWVYERDVPRGMDKDELFSKEFNGKGNSKYTKYRMENDDMHSIWNTVLKMAKKRALVDATLAATRSSGIFTQTEQELEAYLNGDDPEMEGEGTSSSKQNSPARQAAGRASTSGASGTGAAVTPTNKNRVLTLMKQATLDFNGLAKEASVALDRPIKKVMDDLKTDADWVAVGDHLEFLIGSKQDGQGDINFDDLPVDLK